MDCNSKTVEQWPHRLHWLIALPTSASLPTPVHLTSRSLHSSSYVLPLISWKLWWMKRPQICKKISEKTRIIYERIFIKRRGVSHQFDCWCQSIMYFFARQFVLVKRQGYWLRLITWKIFNLMILWPLPQSSSIKFSFPLLSPSGDLIIGLVWDNHPTPTDPLFGLTVEILFKLN